MVVNKPPKGKRYKLKSQKKKKMLHSHLKVSKADQLILTSMAMDGWNVTGPESK